MASDNKDDGENKESSLVRFLFPFPSHSQYLSKWTKTNTAILSRWETRTRLRWTTLTLGGCSTLLLRTLSTLGCSHLHLHSSKPNQEETLNIRIGWWASPKDFIFTPPSALDCLPWEIFFSGSSCGTLIIRIGWIDFHKRYSFHFQSTNFLSREFMWNLHYMWSLPLKIVAIIVLVYTKLGFPAALVTSSSSSSSSSSLSSLFLSIQNWDFLQLWWTTLIKIIKIIQSYTFSFLICFPD